MKLSFNETISFEQIYVIFFMRTFLNFTSCKRLWHCRTFFISSTPQLSGGCNIIVKYIENAPNQ